MGFVVNKRRFKPSGPPEYTVTITIDSYINHAGGALVQTNLSGSMIPVTLSPKDTYRINQPSGSSGITVTASGNNYIISGTPTADVTINCTTTRNPDLLTSTQKDVANWTTGDAPYGYHHSISSTRINWNIPSAASSYRKNEAYCIQLFGTYQPVGDYVLEIRYRITDLSQLDDGCRVGICSNNSNGHVNSTFRCYIDILDTQTTYTTVSTTYTRSTSEIVYLAITNRYWDSNNTSRQGRIYLDSISLREV